MLSKKPPSATSKLGKETAKSKPTTAVPSSASQSTKKLDKISESQNSHTNETDDQFKSSVLEQQLAQPEKPFDPYEDRFDDLTLRCVLYACLFQVLIDKQEYEDALEQMELALNDLPRTKHRLLIYRIKVITKSKLGLDVQMDLQKVNKLKIFIFGLI